MDIGEMVVHGWKFKLVDDELSITSEQDPNVHLELEAKAAFSLLDYLYQYRDDLALAAKGGEESEEDRTRVASDSAFATSASDSTTPEIRPRGL
jgi:hypothetical protein